MKIHNGKFILDDATRFSPETDGVRYVDTTETTVIIPYPLLVRLYEGARFDFERKGGNWEDFCNGLFDA